MTKKILDVGNCSPDHSSIRSMIQRICNAEVLQAHQSSDTMEILAKSHIDLVLVNRKLDIDYSDGIDIIKAIKADDRFRSVPVMLVSNMEDYQQEAVAAGAEYGFGKLALGDPKTHERVLAALQQSSNSDA